MGSPFLIDYPAIGLFLNEGRIRPWTSGLSVSLVPASISLLAYLPTERTDIGRREMGDVYLG